MPIMHEYDYLFAFGVIFCTLDAYNIGANDCANSWATSISSRSLTLKQAVLGAAIFEFLGAVLVGSRTASTIKNGIVPAAIFEDNAGLQLLGFVNAIFISSVWLTIATRLQFPVSTTYSIVSAIAGVGIALGGWDAPQWGWDNAHGLGAIFAGLVIAPAIAAGFGAVCYLLVKYIVLKRENSLKWALYTSPFWFFLVTAVSTMSVIYKGAPNLGLKSMSSGKMAAAIVLTSFVIAVLSVVIWLPYVWCKVIRKDYTIRFYHFFLGPLNWWRKAPADAGSVNAPRHVIDYRIYDRDQPEQPVFAAGQNSEEANAESGIGAEQKGEKLGSDSSEAGEHNHQSRLEETSKPAKVPIEGSIFNKAWIVLRYRVYPFIVFCLTHGTSVDIHAMQSKEGGFTGNKMQETYRRAVQYPNETEFAFSFVQVMTSCVGSFGHGANDLGNAIGPFSVIYYTWKNSAVAGKSSPVEVWMLAYGAITLCVGLATYGYHTMAILGNRITLMSPSRGFCMELGSAITVILASQYGIPTSTTMCITGGTIGVALMNGDVRSINWRTILWIFCGWLATIVIVCTASACCLAIIINAPRP